MNKRGLKSHVFVIPILFALLACSGGADGGGAGNNNENVEAAKNQAAKDRVAEWGQLVGLDAATAESELTSAGLIGQVGNNAALNETEAQSFLELTFARDKTFSDGIEELNRRNQKAFLSFVAAKREANSFTAAQPLLTPTEVEEFSASSGFGFNQIQVVKDLRQTAVNDYLNMSAQALTLRDRILEGARILGFSLQPVPARELLVDEGFTTLRNGFAGPVVRAFFARTLDPDFDKEGFPDFSLVANEEQIQLAAEPLAEVTFKVGPRFISFYQFNISANSAVSAPADSVTIEVNPSFGGGISSGLGEPAPPPPTARGLFKVIPAAENSFPFALLNQGPALNEKDF